jgi:UV DNA damage endonuclease
MLTDQSFVDRKSAQAWLTAHNTRTTTVAHLDTLSTTAVVDKIVGIITHNQQALMAQFTAMSAWPVNLRMVRVGSELLPVRTFDRYKHLYDQPVVQKALQGFAAVGDLARKWDIRLSSHPGQFTILTSATPAVVDRAVLDLEYHAEIFRLMGYLSTDHRQEINIHGGARRTDFVPAFVHGMNRLSQDCQAWLSVENDEFSYGLDDLLPLADRIKICVDIHHHWIHTGSYLDPGDARLDAVIASWRGARPEMHVAQTAESVLGNHDPTVMPNMAVLEAAGYRRGKLRAHSEQMWNQALNSYALQFWDRFDLCCECKSKNLGSHQLYTHKQTASTSVLS